VCSLPESLSKYIIGQTTMDVDDVIRNGIVERHPSSVAAPFLAKSNPSVAFVIGYRQFRAEYGMKSTTRTRLCSCSWHVCSMPNAIKEIQWVMGSYDCP
jgi:hypothetical protein